jgi:hypothetical protein
MIRLVLVPDSANGTQVKVFSSSQTNREFKPLWNEIYTTRFDQILIRQGLAAYKGDVLFVGTKRNGVYPDR